MDQVRILSILAAGCLLPSAVVGAAAQVDSTAPRSLTRTVDYEPFWSPDGGRIVFVSNRAGRFNVYTMRAGGGDVRRVTRGPGPDDTPSWSPDGRRIAFVSEQDGNPEVYVVNADGTGLRRLTRDPGLDLHPVWSPDGRRILFNSSRRSRDAADPETIELWSMTPDGGDARPLTEGGIVTYGSWSPDGATILARRSAGEGRSEIVLLPGGGGAPRAVAPSGAFDGWPSWAPDGRSIVFASDREGSFRIYRMDTDGGGLRRLTTGEGRYTNPRWSPDGRTLLYTGRCAEEGDVEIFALATRDAPTRGGPRGR